MTTTALRTTTTTDDVLDALADVTGFDTSDSLTPGRVVRSVVVEGDGVTVHLGPPSGSTSSAVLLVADSLDALRGVEGIDRVSIVVEDHPDSAKINADFAAASFSCGPGVSDTFAIRAYLAAVERSVAAHLTLTGDGLDMVGSLMLRDLRGERFTTDLLRRRSALGLSTCPNSRVCVDEHGRPVPRQRVRMTLHLAPPPTSH